jgi:hypothetical protein
MENLILRSNLLKKKTLVKSNKTVYISMELYYNILIMKHGVMLWN